MVDIHQFSMLVIFRKQKGILVFHEGSLYLRWMPMTSQNRTWVSSCCRSLILMGRVLCPSTRWIDPTDTLVSSYENWHLLAMTGPFACVLLRFCGHSLAAAMAWERRIESVDVVAWVVRKEWETRTLGERCLRQGRLLHCLDYPNLHCSGRGGVDPVLGFGLEHDAEDAGAVYSWVGHSWRCHRRHSEHLGFGPKWHFFHGNCGCSCRSCFRRNHHHHHHHRQLEQVDHCDTPCEEHFEKHTQKHWAWRWNRTTPTMHRNGEVDCSSFLWNESPCDNPWSLWESALAFLMLATA